MRGPRQPYRHRHRALCCKSCVCVCVTCSFLGDGKTQSSRPVHAEGPEQVIERGRFLEPGMLGGCDHGRPEPVPLLLQVPVHCAGGVCQVGASQLLKLSLREVKRCVEAAHEEKGQETDRSRRRVLPHTACVPILFLHHVVTMLILHWWNDGEQSNRCNWFDKVQSSHEQT